MKDKGLKWLFLTELIPYGKDNAILGKDLQNALKMPERALYSQIQSAREDGIIICACNTGYFQPESEEELLHYYNTAHKRAVTSLATLKTVRRILVKKGIKVK